MNTALITRFSRIGQLYLASDIHSATNYFRIYSSPDLRQSTEKQFCEWETCLQALDPDSWLYFLQKAKGTVSATPIPQRGWTQLVASINEARSYYQLIKMGYTDVRMIRAGTSNPDLEGSSTKGHFLAEVKTINESDEEISLRDEVQIGEPGLPARLQRVLRKHFNKALLQIQNHPRSENAKKIIFFYIMLDLPTLLENRNRRLLREFLENMKEDVEFIVDSGAWPGES